MSGLADAWCSPKVAVNMVTGGGPGWRPGLSMSGGGRSGVIKSGGRPASTVDEWPSWDELINWTTVGSEPCRGRFLRVGSPINSAGSVASSPPPQVRAARINARLGCVQILLGSWLVVHSASMRARVMPWPANWSTCTRGHGEAA